MQHLAPSSSGAVPGEDSGFWRNHHWGSWNQIFVIWNLRIQFDISIVTGNQTGVTLTNMVLDAAWPAGPPAVSFFWDYSICSLWCIIVEGRSLMMWLKMSKWRTLFWGTPTVIFSLFISTTTTTRYENHFGVFSAFCRFYQGTLLSYMVKCYLDVEYSHSYFTSRIHLFGPYLCWDLE